MYSSSGYTALTLGDPVVGKQRGHKPTLGVRLVSRSLFWLCLLLVFFGMIYVCMSLLPKDDSETKDGFRDGQDAENKNVRGMSFKGPQNAEQRAVVNAFLHAWSAYKKFAWGKDELRPVSQTHNTEFDVGLTLIDSLDTMYIMGLEDEFAEARNWVATELNLDINRDESLFEVTIRVLGGLLGAYHVSGDDIFLGKAKEVGDRLLPAFTGKANVPLVDVNLKTHHAHGPRWGLDSTTAEVTTIQLEFRDLSRATGDPKYERAVEAVAEHVHNQPKKDGLVPILISSDSGKFQDQGAITMGAGGDSYYEYLLKGWIQTGKTRDSLKQDYTEAVEGMKTHLLKESEPNKLLYMGELPGGDAFSPKMDHLVCFLGGTLALGSHHGLDPSHLTLGKRLTETCYELYRRMPTGLSPEIAFFNQAPGAEEDLVVKPGDTDFRQRPETVESLFYLYRFTQDKKYRDWGWKIFQAIEKYTKLPNGYTTIKDVKNTKDPGSHDKMETFFLGELLKYLYLLFSDDPNEISLDKYVFNTEAHPLPVYSS